MATNFTGMSWPIGLRLSHPNITSMTSSVIDLTGKKIAFCGHVWFQERTGTKTITAVGFKFGTVVKAGGSGLTLSLQDPSTTVSQAPDDTQDQTVAIANGDAGFASNLWYTATLSSSRAVAFGERLCVVWEFDGGGRLGADSVAIASVLSQSSYHSCFGAARTAAGVWGANTTNTPDVVFVYSDGSIGTFGGALPCTTTGSQVTVPAGGEYALEFGLDRDFILDGATFQYDVGGDTNAAVTLYKCNDEVVARTFVGRWQKNTDGSGTDPSYTASAFLNSIACTANTTYRLAVRPTVSINGYYMQVAAASHLVCYVGGTSWRFASRLSATACWMIEPTKRPMIHPVFGGL